MSIIKIKFESEQDYHRAAAIHGTLLEEEGWKPNPETSLTMLVGNSERADELKRRLANAGIAFQDTSGAK